MKRWWFHIKKNPSGKYYFVFSDDDGFILVSKSFSDRASLEDCIVQLRKFSDISQIVFNGKNNLYPCMQVQQDNNNQYFFQAIGLNGQIVMTSMPYNSKDECCEGISLLKQFSREARIADYT